ncbi:TPA: hypothetical protein KD862_003519 [Vibrio cholerae]|uniref:hypothetical protein n=1 Tax=Vibrio cholerae TaxID=666 RepID=UPI0018F0AE4B|nr:hypothetical protein [Vibrio cholerae]EGR2435312.1 hypothetical protein [Vibrio cholerae]MBJ6907081.1 hypothetical protein [Vibrio cholerae]MCR9709306.1 hypothetical protein [Vibrio cholerae]HBC3849573.1 hypothetical protein [Vibrio cholerae]
MFGVIILEFGKVRVAYSLVSFAIAYASYECYEIFLDSNSKNLDYLSYIGTVATVIALLITICEVIHNVNVSRSIKKEATVIFERVKKVENASTISECLSALDDLNSAIGTNDFKSALKIFQFFRKLSAKTGLNIGEFGEDKKLGTVGDLEYEIMSATHSSNEAPLTPAQKKNMTKKVLIIKQQIEESNPAKGGSDNVAT